jgi:outer membrane receptor protein involved in Fe transport
MKLMTQVKLLLLAVCFLALSPASFGQAVYGSIYGTVTDASGALVPNATVTVTDEAKGTSVTLQSNDSGEFKADHLIPDLYDVKVAATGFEGFLQKGIQLFADTSVKVEAILKAGASDQTVEVTADSVPQLKTDRADVATIFGAKEVVDLPVPARNFTALQLLLPGAQQLGWSHAASEDPQGSLQIMVDGQAFAGVAYGLDGTDNQDPILGIIVINPNLDSLSETKVTTQNYDAEFGKAVSSVVTAQTKSGSNKFHGSAFDYRISAANLARDPYTQSPTALFPQALKSQFGGSIGGPILKDKIFFFGDYQGVRQKVGKSNLQTVPSALLVATCLGQQVGPSGIPGCDFSQYAGITPAGTGIIYQANGVPYPGNTIPASQVSPQAKAFFALLQPYAPNNFSDNAYPGLRNNYSAGGTGLFNSNQWDVRGDYQATQRIHVFGRFSRFTDTLTGLTLFGSAGGSGFGIGGFGGTSVGANDSVALGTDIAINAKLVTDVRLGYFRYNIGTVKYSQNNLATQLGIPGLNTGAFGTSGPPGFNLTEVGAQGAPANGQNAGSQYGAGLNINRCNCPLIEREDQFQLVNNWTRIIGNHSVKVGADLRYARNLRVPSDANRTGVLQFGTGPTSNPNLAPQGGLGFATFALGEVTQLDRYTSISTNAKEFQKRDFFYAQDTWRVTPKLTVNYGLRYELYFPETINGPSNGALMNVDTGYLYVASIGTIPSNMGWIKPHNAYNPRVGIAYQVAPPTVIRAGYGRSFDIGVFGSIFGHASTQNLPILSKQQITTTTGITGFAFTLANGPPAQAPTAVPANGLLPNPGYAVNSGARPNPLRLPTLDAWNLSLQESLTPTLSLTMAYVGNKGTHTLADTSGNNTNPNEAAIFLPAQYSLTGQALHYDPTVKSGIAANGGTANQTFLRRYYGGTLPACADPAYATPVGVAKGQCGWSNDITYFGDNMDSHFNALQVTLAKVFTHGYSVTANYAWQRGTSWQSGFYTWNPRAAKGRDSNIRQQQIIIYGLAELPFGRNKLVLSNANAVVNQIVGGWQISPVINYSSGLPFSLSYSSCNASIPGDAPCLVNGQPSRFQPHVTGFPGNGLSYYDPQTLGSVFTATGLDQIGTIGRNSVFGPHFFNTDISVQKNFPIKERVALQFRMDAFNAFNHINFGLPGGNIEQSGSITAGPGVDGTANPRQLQFVVRVQF